ncbi:MAG TPA: hypothetical protein VLY23_04895 [Candidatus Acidoferrum sp.]|nr:hypothetical protein [Candidatus Acidoferrum sp.]
MGLFDSTEEHPPAKVRRYVITGVASAVIAFLLIWYWPGDLRFYKEKSTVRHFVNAVVAGNMQEAYQIWKPSPTYSFKDFLEDWGPNGYYGTIKSYRIGSAQGVKNGPSAAIIVEVSPYQPFPSGENDPKANKTQKIVLWVDPRDRSISFPPY